LQARYISQANADSSDVGGEQLEIIAPGATVEVEYGCLSAFLRADKNSAQLQLFQCIYMHPKQSVSVV